MNGDVLVIDHDPQRVASVRNDLLKRCNNLRSAETVQRAVRQMVCHSFDLVALNVTTSGSDQMIDLLLELKKEQETFLLLYPLEDHRRRADLLCQGVDMCLASETAEECSAAILALLRKMKTVCGDARKTACGKVVYQEFSIDFLRHRVLMSGRQVVLTALEFKILSLLVNNAGFVLSKEKIFEHLWNIDSDYGCKSVSDHISKIRKKLGLMRNDEVYIKTFIGTGYCFAPRR